MMDQQFQERVLDWIERSPPRVFQIRRSDVGF